MDDRALWDAFDESRIPDAHWTHREHLRIAWMFLDRHPLDDAHVLMRVGIIRLNAFHGLVETPSRGYHETLTRVWLALVARLRTASEVAAVSSEAFVDAHAGQLSRDAVLSHYSREHLMSVRARAIFVEPDLAPLP
jgi:hypothetical protein